MKFQEAILKHDKDFFLISSFVSTRLSQACNERPKSCLTFQLATKSVKQCVQFYYTWKKICTDDYKRLRAARRRRILPAMALEPNVYDLRSLGPIEPIVPSAAVGSPFMTSSYDQQGQQEPSESISSLRGKLLNEDAIRQRDDDLGSTAGDFVSADGSGNDGGAFKAQYENEVSNGFGKIPGWKQKLFDFQVEPMMKAYNRSPYRESPAPETGSTSDTLFPCRLCGK